MRHAERVPCRRVGCGGAAGSVIVTKLQGRRDASYSSWSMFLHEGGLLRINTTEREGTAHRRAEDENPQSWNLDINSHYQEATEHRLSPDSNPLHACCCCKMDRVIKENTPQEPKPNNSRQHKFSEPLALSPRQLKRAQNRLKYEMNSEAWE